MTNFWPRIRKHYSAIGLGRLRIVPIVKATSLVFLGSWVLQVRGSREIAQVKRIIEWDVHLTDQCHEGISGARGNCCGEDGKGEAKSATSRIFSDSPAMRW